MRSLIAAAATAALLVVIPAAGGTTTSTPRCETPNLVASLVAGSPGAGQRYATLRLTNVGPSACHLRGYPGAQLLRAHGVHVPTNIVRDPATVTDVTLARGDRAVSQWHWGAVASGNESTTSACEPSALHIRVTPPNALKAHKLRWKFGAVCDYGRIDVTPMTAE